MLEITNCLFKLSLNTSKDRFEAGIFINFPTILDENFFKNYPELQAISVFGNLPDARVTIA